MATDTCKWNETALLVIDMQNDFVGSPMLAASAKVILPKVAEAVSLARERDIFIIWVVREHDPLGRDVELFRKHYYSNGKGFAIKGSKGAELVEGFKIEEGDYKLVKPRFSAFFNTHLDAVLRGSGIKSLVVVGGSDSELHQANCV
ncbi:hypothetical protein LUZ61_015353 [Rhynchospora tenuis]|uniref:Isochorismatase-like domain-containing protein n=1 Tax=Rhynchospora tenuis TaxID=198213 RepID=A0AAD5WD87_9POAL|nr:hypothetical protein LUZ61_015353 [Rhynchospora tenuis]